MPHRMRCCGRPGGKARRHGQQFASCRRTRHGPRAVEISERKDAYVVSAELPGLSADEVEITFGDGLLTIQGERHASRDAAAETVHRSERRYGPFRRSITLPSHVQAGKIEASTQDGVLQVLVPKAPDVQAKRIPVRARPGRRSSSRQAQRSTTAADSSRPHRPRIHHLRTTLLRHPCLPQR